MTSSEIEVLIERAKTGDRVALEALLMTHAEELSAHSSRRIPAELQRTFSVEDILQETFLEAFSKIERFRESTPRAFLAWLKAIADVCLLRVIREQGRKKRGGQFHRLENAVDSATGSLAQLVKALPGDGCTASSVVARREAIAALQVGIAGLPPQQRRAIQLHLIEGKSLEETAITLDCTKGAVRALVHRAKQRLADVLGRASKWMSHR